MNILIAEPHADTAEMMDQYFTQEGHHVHLCENGEKAVAEMERSVPDVLVSELILPVMDGFDLVTRLRHEGYSDTVMIAHSSYYFETAIEKVEQSGFDFYSLKPMSMHLFDQALRATRQRVLILLTTELQRSKILIAECKLACRRSKELIAAAREGRPAKYIPRA